MDVKQLPSYLPKYRSKHATDNVVYDIAEFVIHKNGKQRHYIGFIFGLEELFRDKYNLLYSARVDGPVPTVVGADRANILQMPLDEIIMYASYTTKGKKIVICERPKRTKAARAQAL